MGDDPQSLLAPLAHSAPADPAAIARLIDYDDVVLFAGDRRNTASGFDRLRGGDVVEGARSA